MLLDNFKTHTLVFQVQYKEAFLLWDNAGKIASAMKEIWNDLSVRTGAPNQQVLASKRCQVNVALNASTITLRGENLLRESVFNKISDAFNIWKEQLSLIELSRISARVVFLRNFSSTEETQEYVFSLGLVNWPNKKVFDQPTNSSKNVPEVVFRFEDEKSFAFVRVKTDHSKIEMSLDPDIMEEDVDKEVFRVIVDFDKGNLGSIPVNKIKVNDWFEGYVHLLRRDVDKVLGAQS